MRSRDDLWLVPCLLLLGCGSESSGGALTGSGGDPSIGGSGSGGQGAPGTGGAPGGGSPGAGGASGGAPSSGGSGGTGGSPSVGGAFADGGLEAGGGGSTALQTMPLDAPPSYRGSLNNGAACDQPYETIGFEPTGASGERHPLLLYFVGTAFVQPDDSARHDSEAALKVTEAMARRGFVALSAQYDNGALAWLSDHQNQLGCLFGDGRPESLLAAACGLPQVDCDRGIATWGHSQGAYVGAMAHNYDDRVRAVWTTGYGGDASTTISKNRLRVVNGEADTNNGTVAVLDQITGLTRTDCPNPTDQCLRPDGSGWIIVRRSELRDPTSSSADHCWFDKHGCLDGVISLEPNWVDPASTKPFALEANADWTAATALRTDLP